jgi:hypothetical protein
VPASEVEGGRLIVKLLPLAEPVVAGLSATTRMRYWVPAVDGSGVVLTIVPAEVDETVPIVVGEVKDPEASDNCAVKVFPPVKVPPMVKGILMLVCPAQKGLSEIVPVVIEVILADKITVEVE